MHVNVDARMRIEHKITLYAIIYQECTSIQIPILATYSLHYLYELLAGHPLVPVHLPPT